MALTPCPECGREISTLAATCPHCGAPRPGAGEDFGGPGSAPPQGPMESLGRGLTERWNARKVIYVAAGAALALALISPALATTAVLTAIVYWAADVTLRPGGRASEAPADSWMMRVYEFWRGLSLLGRIAVSLAVGLGLGFFVGTWGR